MSKYCFVEVGCINKNCLNTVLTIKHFLFKPVSVLLEVLPAVRADQGSDEDDRSAL